MSRSGFSGSACLRGKSVWHTIGRLAIWLGAFACATVSAGLAAAADGVPHGPITCQIKPFCGKPVMFIDDEPRFPLAYMSYFPEPFRYRQVGQHGLHVYSVSLTLTDKWFNRIRQRVSHRVHGIWRGPDELDFQPINQALSEIIEADPQAVIFPRIYCDSPAWWDKLHPEEVRVVYEGCPARQSFSSLAWRRETAQVLQKIVQYVAESPYSRHVIGYMICAGQTEEYGDQPDATPCAQQRFRAWLAQRYGPDAGQLSQILGKDLGAIAIPSAQQQRTADCGNFLDPAKSRLTIDYRLFHSDEAVDSAIALCQAVKEASHDRLITGVFYGYTRIWPDWAHLALRRLLKSNAIDFVSNPYSSGGTKSHLWIGERDFHTFTESDSILRAGKLFYYENDIRTSQSRWISQLRPDIDPQGEYDLDAWLGPPTLPESLQLLKAVYAKVLVSGSVNWWFDLWGGWYDHEEIQQLFGEMQKVGEESLRLPHKSAAQIAVFLDENSYRYLPSGVSQFGGRFSWIEGQLAQLGKVGAPYDFFLLDEVQDLDLKPYRMLVFLNAFALSAEQRKTIAERCMTDGRTVLWLYAPGLIQDDLAVANVSKLLGMQCSMTPTRAATKISLNLPGQPIAYTGAAVAPFLYVERGADVAAGRTPEGQVVVAERQAEKCRHVYVAMPPLPWQALQHYARQAGVHLYSDAGDVVFASTQYLAISAAAPGKRTIRLPAKAALKELLPLGPARNFPENTQFEMDFGPHTCRLFQLAH